MLLYVNPNIPPNQKIEKAHELYIKVTNSPHLGSLKSNL